MQLSAEIKQDFDGTIQVTDYTRDPVFDQYLSEDDPSVLVSYDKFKYSQTCTINVLKYQSSKEEMLVNVLYSTHTEESDSMRIPLFKDGYYTVDHIVLPTIEWWEQVKNENLTWYSIIYVTDGFSIYKAVNGELEHVDSVEITEVNPERTTISIQRFNVFNMHGLKQCYLITARKILDDYPKHCQSVDPTLRFNRDFLWMTINVLLYYIEDSRFTEAQLVLEQITCYKLCPDTINYLSKTPSCGCNH